jgi:acyl-CoA reductase-like NAD-dependent aldehyde dehydrogenase
MTVSDTRPKAVEYRHFIGGAEAAPTDAGSIERRDPANGDVVARFARGNAADADRAVRAARQAFDEGEWPRANGPERAAVLRGIAHGIEAAGERLALMDSRESGKTIGTARNDVAGAVGHFRFAASLIETERSDAWTGAATDLLAYSRHEPAGVAALIVPWNFPVLILAQKLAYALAAGCTTVVKPSEFTSGTALEVARIAQSVGLPSGAVNVVTGYGAEVGLPMVTHPGVDVVSFTGSTATGRVVAAAAGDGVKRVSLELGGKGAQVVFADADLEQAADAVVFGAMINNGECCVAGSRILIERATEDHFLALVAERLARVVVGDPRDERTDLGPLIHEAHLDKVLGYLGEDVRAGAAVAAGGRRAVLDGGENGYYVEPTLLRSVAPTSRPFTEEIFGPVVTSTVFDSADEAVALANATPYGLANAVWTADLNRALTVSHRIRSGTVWVNTFLDGTPSIPFGGVRESGFGRETAREGLLEFTTLKTVQIRTGRRAYPIPQGS